MSNIQFYIKSSQSLTALADELMATMQQRQHGVFQPFHIVTQTDGMNNWLKQHIAEKTGIAANMQFFKPNEIINKIYTASGGEFQKTLSKSDMAWLIYDFLASKKIIDSFPDLANYYSKNNSVSDVKRIALAEVVADLFDQYQVYRPEMLKKWNTDKLATIFEEEKWQKEIWKHIKDQSGKKFPDRNRVRDSIIEKLSQPDVIEYLQNKIPCIYFFGISLITRYHLEILIKVSEHIPVYIFLPNPAPEMYWYEDESRKALFYKKKRGADVSYAPEITNPLLLNWGKLIQNTFLMLFQYDEIINQYEIIPSGIVQKKSLLSQVQKYIFENSVPSKALFFDNHLLGDGTISIQSCYGPSREVESLYNYIIHLIDQHKGQYSERDIVVQVTDINKYASYIRAVFNNAPYRLKYTIADESFTSSDSLSKAFYEVLKIDERNFTSEAALQLLDFDCIRKHFSLSDIDLVRRVINEANIRHGIEGNAENDSLYVSWKYGLKRIMYGICISGGEEYGNGPESFFPLDIIESGDAHEVTRLVYFVDQLIELIEARRSERTVKEWGIYLKEVLSRLIFDTEQNETTESNYLIEETDKLVDIEKLFDDKISYSVFLKSFLPKLNENVRSYRFARGGITFCSLIPMRSIPFKIVAMLGLDFDKFPRKPAKTGFDLMTKAPQTGDRNIKINDKHLFLETVLSAGDFLYMSYTGQKINDNAKQPPSILVDELISFIESISKDPKSVRKELIVHQPLQSFSNKYFTDEKLFDYLNVPSVKNTEILNGNRVEVPAVDEIKLHNFLSFFKDPVKAYYNKVLSIYYNISDSTLPEIELFDLDHLQLWQLKQDLLSMEEQDKEKWIISKVKKGTLPLGNVGALAVMNAEETIEKLRELFIAEKENHERSFQDINITIGKHQLTGNIENVFGKKIIHVCVSKNANKYLFEAYISALLVAVSSFPHDIFLLTDKSIKAEKISRKEAEKHLTELINLYKKGFAELLPFSSDWAITLEQLNSLTEKKLSDKIELYADDYTKRELESGIFSQNNILEKYREIAENILKNIAIVFPNYSDNVKK